MSKKKVDRLADALRAAQNANPDADIGHPNIRPHVVALDAELARIKKHEQRERRGNGGRKSCYSLRWDR